MIFNLSGKRFGGKSPEASRPRAVKMANLAAQLDQINPGFQEVWNSMLKNGSFIGGDAVKNFETDFEAFTGAKYAIGVANGTDAIEIILKSLLLPPGATVLVPGNTFVATAEAVLNSGLSLKLVDIDSSFGFSKEDLLRKLTPDVKAVIAVHLYGLPQDIDWLIKLASDRGIFVLEDCAQAHGASIDGRHVGRFGFAGAFSFYPGKNLGALGDGGAIITDNEDLAERARRISNHGRLSKFDHLIVGRNSRLDSLQAAVLGLKLPMLNNWNQRRVENAVRYRQNLSGISELKLPPESLGTQVYHHFVIQTIRRDELREYLFSLGIETGIHYPQSIDEMEAYAAFAGDPLLESRRASSRMISLPVAEHLSEMDIDLVSLHIKRFFEI